MAGAGGVTDAPPGRHGRDVLRRHSDSLIARSGRRRRESGVNFSLEFLGKFAVMPRHRLRLELVESSTRPPRQAGRVGPSGSGPTPNPSLRRIGPPTPNEIDRCCVWLPPRLRLGATFPPRGRWYGVGTNSLAREGKRPWLPPHRGGRPVGSGSRPEDRFTSPVSRRATSPGRRAAASSSAAPARRPGGRTRTRWRAAPVAARR